MSMAGNLRKVTSLGGVGGLRKVARLARRRPRVDLSHPARSPLGSSVVNCVTYRDGVRTPARGDLVDVVERVRKNREGFVWLGLHEPTDQEFAGIADLFDLHPLAVEDAVEAHQRPKVERYGETLFAVFKTVCYVEHEQLTATSEVVNTGEIMVFVGADFVITVRHGRHGSLGPLREELESDPRQLAKGPSAVLHAIADHVVDDYLTVTDSVQADIDQVETDVFTETGARADPGRIYQLKRELLELKRAVVPLSRPLEDLATRPIRAVDPEIQAYFRDVSDHPAGTPRAGHGRAERGHAEDHGVGRDHRRADDGLRGVRHELRAHAGAALAIRLRHGHRRHIRRVRGAVPGVPAQRLALTRALTCGGGLRDDLRDDARGQRVVVA
jgi:magnesium transporter